MGAAEISAARDGSTWYGGSATGCMTVRRLCIGGRVRFARTAGAVDSIVGGGELTRRAVGATAVVVLPLGHGRFSVAPTLGLGAEWAHTALAVDVLTVSADDVVLRGAGAVIARLSIAGGWSLLAELGGDFRTGPLGRCAPGVGGAAGGGGGAAAAPPLGDAAWRDRHRVFSMTDRLIPFRRPERRDALPDEALLEASAKGDNTAVEELFQRHGDRVHGILARLGGLDQKDLEDVVQATFMAVQRSARRFDRRSAVGTWIVGIALNIARRHVRGDVRRRLAMLAVAESHPRHQAAGPDEQASHRQLMARLLTGFEALPADQRTVFVLCDLEGMRGVDVARALRLPQGTVWRRLHDARLRLRALVEGKVQS